MKRILPITYFITVAFIMTACQEKPKPPKAAPSIPIVLEGKHVDVSSLAELKRYNQNLMESIYKELMGQSEELKKLDQAIKTLQGQHNKAVDSFNIYNGQNTNYYQSANQGARQISDSVLREKVQSLIGRSLKEYNSRVRSHHELDSLIGRKTATINDLYILLKVVKTLPAMHNYQQERLPGKGSAEMLNRQLDSLVHTFDSLHTYLK